MFERILSALEASWGGGKVCVSACTCTVHVYVFRHTENVDSCPVSHSDHTSLACSNYPLCL